MRSTRGPLQGIYPLVVTAIMLNLLLVVALVLADFSHGNMSRVALTATVVGSVILGAVFLFWVRTNSLLLATPATNVRAVNVVWSAVVSVPVAAAIAFSPEAAYAALALYVVVLWLIPNPIGTVAVLTLCVGVVAGQAVHHGWTVGGVLGPVVSAVAIVALLAGYRSMVRVAAENAALAQQLQEMSVALARTEREAGRAGERSRLGRDLHDTTAQHLSSIRLLLAAARRSDDVEQSGALLTQANELSLHALTEIRALVDDLTPPALQGETFPDAVKRLVSETSARVNADVRAPLVQIDYVESGDRFPMLPPVSAALFRVCGEAVNNAVNHAAATHLTVHIEFARSSLIVEINDDGTGFDPQSYFIGDGHGHGIPGMRSRLRELGGTLAIVSEPGEGALVRAELPRTRAERFVEHTNSEET